ncbi:hypothetical protein D3C86_1291590 [compost metagenome]
MFRAAGQVGIARRDFTRTHVDLVHATAHRRHRARQAFLHALHGSHQVADFVVCGGFHAHGQVTARDLVEAVADGAQGAQHDAIHEQERTEGHGQDQRGQAQVHVGHHRRLSARGLHLLLAVGADVVGESGQFFEERTAGGARLGVLQGQVGGGVALVQRAHHRLQRIGKAVERRDQCAFGGLARFRHLRNGLEGLYLLLRVADQLLHRARVVGRAIGVTGRALRGGNVGTNRGAQHLRIGILDQVALLHAQRVERVDRHGAGTHAVPAQTNCNQCGQGNCQLSEHQARTHLQIAEHFPIVPVVVPVARDGRRSVKGNDLFVSDCLFNALTRDSSEGLPIVVRRRGPAAGC